MNKDEAKQLLPIIKAYSEGKQIQTSWKEEDEWIDGDNLVLSSTDTLKYRIKPEPRECYVAFENSGIPVGICKDKADTNNSSYEYILMREVEK